MKIESRSDFDHRIRQAWRSGEELQLCLSILEFVAAHPGTLHIPFARLEEIAREAALKDPEVVARVIQYLTGADSRLLEVAGELIDEDDSPYLLDEEEFGYAITKGINPLTGSHDPELPKKLFVFFRPSSLAQQVLWGPHVN